MEKTRVLGPRPSEPPGLPRGRAEVLRLLRDQDQPCALAALSGLSGLHENTLRGHLLALEEAGLVSRSTATPDGRGRPASLWTAVPSPPPSEYAALAGALAAALARTSADPVGDALVSGTEWGTRLVREHAPDDATDTADGRRRHVVDLMDRLGFAPESSPDGQQVRLTRCPLLEVAHQHPDIVCTVHTGLVRGALAELGDESTDVSLEPFAEPGACLLHLTETRP